MADSREPLARRNGFRIGVTTFGILALELALIRWTSGQVRVFAYFNNLVLIGAFLGLGLGLALGRRRPGLVRGMLPLLLLLSLVLAFSGPLGLMHMRFPDGAVALWGGETATRGFADMAVKLGAFIGLFLGIVAVFLLGGSALGELFAQAPPLRAYSADLVGSLLGIVAFTVATFLHATPPVWLLLGALPFAWLANRPLSWVALCGTVALGWHSTGEAVFSAYNRIDIVRNGRDLTLSVNRDFHQFMHDLSDATLQDPAIPEVVRTRAVGIRKTYDIPFVLDDARGRVLVVGAGTGNDVQAALRNGYASVTSVDIDARIIELGRRLHPERPYDDPRVVPVVNDARAFFEQYHGPPFDVVCYGLLDSHAMFSALSSLRLDNYVYTEEGIRAAWKHVADHGHLSLSFSLFGGPWLGDRLYWTIFKATGVPPVMINHGMQHGCTFVASKDPGRLHLERVAEFPRLGPFLAEKKVRTTSDDWPFLYVRPQVFPWGYAVVLTFVLTLAAIATPWAFGWRSLRSDFDPVLFLMGAGFLLIETRGVTTLSLLFGSTWLVNSAVFAGIVVMALIANLAVEWRGAPRTELAFFFLLLSVLVVYGVDNAALNRFDLVWRGLAGGLLNALPIGFAGLVVSALLARSSNPAAALGSNLLGSVLGGCLEYLSMAVGLRALALMALALYLGALLCQLRRGATRS